MKRWFFRILIGTGCLVLLLLAAIQVILWTDLPRNWVISAIEQKLQLRVSSEHFSTGWLGHTSLSNVQVSLPLARESFLQADSLTIDHSTLFSLLLGRSLTVDTVTINRPNLLVRQQADGRWNLAEVAELIKRSGGGKQPEMQEKTAPASIPTLPALNVSDAIVRVIDREGKQATLQPLSVKGRADGALVWRYDIQIPNQLALVGEVAPGGNWQHQVDLKLANLGALIRPFTSEQSAAALNSMTLDGHWTGRVEGDLIGRLDITSLQASGYSAIGALNIATGGADGSLITLTPSSLVVTPPNPNFPPARANGGWIAFDGRSLTARELSLAFAGGELRLAGSYAWNSGVGKLDAWWNQLILPPGTIHNGSLSASIRQPWPDQPVIQADLTSTGQHGSDQWSARAALKGSGKSWNQIDWKLIAPEVAYRQGKQSFDLSNLALAFSTRDQLVTLDSLELPPGTLYGPFQRGTLGGKGRYDLRTGQWFAYITGERWPIGKTDSAIGAGNWIVNLYGDLHRATLDQFFLKSGGFQAWAKGDLDYSRPGMPGQLDLYGWYPPLKYTWHDEQARPTDQDIHLTGSLRSELHLARNFWPFDFDVRGIVFARDFMIDNHPIGDVDIHLVGKAEPKRLHVTATKFKLLDSDWDFTGDYAFGDRLTSIAVELYALPLAQLDHFIAPPPRLRGDLRAQLALKLPNFDVDRMAADGDYRIDRLARFIPGAKPAPAVAATSLATAARGDAIPASLVIFPASQPAPGGTLEAAAPGRLLPLADSIDGRITAADGILRLDKIRARSKGNQAAEGLADASLSLPIRNPRKMDFQASVAAWPLYLESDRTGQITSALVWGQTKLALDLQKMTATGPVELQTTFALRDTTVATVRAQAQMDQRRIELKTLKGDILGAPISGEGYFLFDAPFQSAGRVSWDKIDATRLIQLYPVVKGLRGTYSGEIVFAPSSPDAKPPAPGPFSIKATVRAQGAGLQQMDIGDLNLIGYLDRNRAVLDQLKWSVADGTVSGWGRITWYNNSPFFHANLAFDRLDLDQLVKAVRPPEQVHKPTPGRLKGSFVAAGNPFTDSGRRQASGDAKIQIVDSDLANVGFVTALYNLLSIKWGPPVPTGRGFVTARLEGPRLEIPAVKYFNRGVDLWASATIDDVFKGGDSTIDGSAAGTARPLKDLKLPFMADVDKLLAALQGNLQTVKITGPLKDPKFPPVPFAESSGALRRLLFGEVQNEVKGSAGR